MKADLHIHTTFSYDGISSPKEVVKAALKKGIDCIGISDHGEIGGAIEAMKAGYDENILVIPCIEIVSSSGDILGINIKKKIPNMLSAEETIKAIRKQGGIAVIPHPFDRPITGFSGGAKKIEGIDVDGIEAFNAGVILKRSNNEASDFCQRTSLPFTAGSDAHRAKFIGRGYIELKHVSSAEELIEEILLKRVKAGGRPLSLWEVFQNSTRADIGRMSSFFFSKYFN